MTGRWVCPRCFTSAPETAVACPNCGLARGAEPRVVSPPSTEPEASLPAPATPSPTAQESAGAAPRWVCLQCFASNDGSATSCANCGQARGTTPAPQAGMASTSAGPARLPTGSRIPWRLVIYGVIAVVVAGSAFLFAARRDDGGTITSPGSLSVFDLQVGDCFDVDADTPGGNQEVDTVQAKPCSDQHVYEVFWVGDYPAADMPDEPTSMAWLQDQCVPAFEDYVDFAFEDSLYWVSTLSPTEDGWNGGDHEFTCYLHNETATPLTGSARGAAQ